jgi:hypothetical protein
MEIPLPPPNYEQTIQAIESCGIATGKILIKYQDYLQSDEVTLSDIGKITSAKLRCLRTAVHPFYILTLARAEQRDAFDELYRTDRRPEELRKAKQWAGARGKTAQIPVFDKAGGVTVFARALERSCDLKEGSVFVDEGNRFLALNRGYAAGLNFDEGVKIFECVMQMFTASNAEENGIRFGFVGYEAEEKN